MGYPTKVQLISREKGNQWYVNFPNALAEASNASRISRSPGAMVRTTVGIPRAFRRPSRNPPWPWTMALGGPGVPDEYSTQRGCSKGTASNDSSAVSPSRSSRCWKI